MKRLLSMILAAAMVASMMTPVAYADDTLPITEPAATVQEQPAEDTPAETVPVETPTQEATPAPTETPVEATPAPTAEPTATPEPTEMPTPEPTVEPTAEPTAEPVPTEEPVEIVADAPEEQAAEAATPTETASSADADPETTLILYKSADPDYYYGKLPVKVGNTGTNAMPIMDYSTGHQDTPGSTYITVRGDDSDFNNGVSVMFIDGDYWVYAPVENYPLVSVTYYDPMPNDDGTYNKITLPVQVSDTEAPEGYEEPYKFIHGYLSPNFSIGGQPTSTPDYDTDYTVKLNLNGYKILTVSGLNGVEVVSQPDADGNVVVRFPSGIKYGYAVDVELRALAGLSVVAQDSNGSYFYAIKEFQYVPGVYWESIYGSPEWNELLSADGKALKLAPNNSWSKYGEIKDVKVTLHNNAYEEEDLCDYVTAVYDKSNDAVNVKLSKEPTDVDSATWFLSLALTYADGTICYSWREVQKTTASTQLVSDRVSIGEKAGSTNKGTLYQYNSETGKYDIPYQAGDDAEVVLDKYPYGLSIDSGTLSDYLDVTYDNVTAQIMATVKKDIPLNSSNSSHYVDCTVETKYATTASFRLNIGAPNVYPYNSVLNYFDLCSEHGSNLEASLNSSYNRTAWSALGTLDTATGPSAVLTYNDSDGTAHEVPVTATYDAVKDVVNLKMARSDVPDADVNAVICVTFPCAEYTLTVKTSVYQKSSFSISTTNKNPGTLGTKVGASMTMDITYYDNQAYSDQPMPDLDWTWSGACYDSNADISSDEMLTYGNNLTDNNTALVLDGYQRYVYINGNTFLNNKTGVLVAETCNLDGSYSSMYGVKVNGGTTNHNLFYLNAGQIAVSNQPNGDTAANFTYNYFATPKDGKFVDAVPKNDMFEGSVLYVPFYETPEMDTVNTDKSLDDIAKENQEDTTKAKLELAAAQGSSTPGGIDSSLTLSGNKFEELQKESNKAKSMEVTVKSTSNETDVIWDFEKDKLKDDYDGSSVNLGVAFTFTDFEQDIVSNVVTKSKEDGTTLNSIAYQAMCFSHSGDLPGEATVKIRMNESLLDYYSKHNNSLEGFKIYYVNEGTGKLEVMRDASGNPKTLSVEVVDGVYFAVTSIDHCSSYLLTPEDLNEAISGLTKILLNAGAPLTLDELTQPDGAVLRLLSHMEPGVTLNKLAQYLSGGSMTVLDTNGNKVGADAPLGTGYTIGLGADGKTGGVTVAVAGDLNGDGSVDTKDLTMMRQAILQIGQLTQVQLKAATPSTNGSRVDTNDLVLLRRYLLSMTKTMLD